MQSLDETRNKLDQIFNAIRIKEPHKTYWVNILTTPIFLIFLILSFLFIVFNTFPGLRAYIPLAEEKSTNVVLPPTNSTSTPPISIKDSACVNIGQTGGTSIQNCNNQPPTKISYKINSPSKIKNDGLYQTNLTLTLSSTCNTPEPPLSSVKVVDLNSLVCRMTSYNHYGSCLNKPQPIYIENEYLFTCTSSAPLLEKQDYFKYTN